MFADDNVPLFAANVPFSPLKRHVIKQLNDMQHLFPLYPSLLTEICLYSFPAHKLVTLSCCTNFTVLEKQLIFFLNKMQMFCIYRGNLFRSGPMTVGSAVSAVQEETCAALVLWQIWIFRMTTHVSPHANICKSLSVPMYIHRCLPPSPQTAVGHPDLSKDIAFIWGGGGEGRKRKLLVKYYDYFKGMES